MENQFITAQGPDAPDDGGEGLQQRGLAVATLEPIERGRSFYRVPVQFKDGFYIVSLESDYGPNCDCPDFELYQRPCKHIYAVQLALRREERRECGRDQKDGVHQPMANKQKTYQRNWRAYDKAQNNEPKHFEVLLRALCGPHRATASVWPGTSALNSLGYGLLRRLQSVPTVVQATGNVRHRTGARARIHRRGAIRQQHQPVS